MSKSRKPRRPQHIAPSSNRRVWILGGITLTLAVGVAWFLLRDSGRSGGSASGAQNRVGSPGLNPRAVFGPTIPNSASPRDTGPGFTPPLAEFILNDPYRAMAQLVKSKAYKGKETVDGVECHRLTFGGEVADSELWIGVADLLPHRLVATFKDREGSPQLQADFSNWNLSATLDEKFFAFVAPQDAEGVEMATDAQMKEISAKETAPQ